jgi:hypothetical protein
MTKPKLEIYEYQHKGISVLVKIDYVEGKISLVENSKYEDKQWMFSGRTIDYMEGWRSILGAMNRAVTHAEKKLQAHQQKQEMRVIELMAGVDEELQRSKKRVTKK